MSEYRVAVEAKITREVTVEVDDELYPDPDDQREVAEERAAHEVTWDIETAFPSTSVDVDRADAEPLD